jgi:hypothetical protein
LLGWILGIPVVGKSLFRWAALNRVTPFSMTAIWSATQPGLARVVDLLWKIVKADLGTGKEFESRLLHKFDHDAVTLAQPAR